MGFLSDFATGFFSTSSNTVLENKKRQDDIDDAKKKAIALIDPSAELYQRQKNVDLEYEKKKQQQANDNFLDFVNKSNGTATANPSLAAPDTTGLNTDTDFLSQLSPSSSPSTGGGLMTPTVTAPSPQANAPVADNNSLHNINQKLQNAIKMKAAAAGSGNKQMENYFDTQVDLYKQQYAFEVDNAKNSSKPVTSSEGTNIVDQIQKENDTKLKDPTKYQSDYLPAKINGLIAQPEVQQIQQDSVVKHAALAQAVANITKRTNPAVSTQEVYPLVREQTKKMITSLNVINSVDSRVIDDDKRQAIKDFENVINTIVKSDPTVLDQLKTDPNYAAIFDPATVQNIDKYSKATAASSTETTNKSSSVKEGTTATNPKTGEKRVFKNGAWQHLSFDSKTY